MRRVSFACFYRVFFGNIFAFTKQFLTPMDNKSIKENICRCRKARGFTQEEMADRIGVSVTSYRNIESGSTHLIHPSSAIIAKVLGLSPEELFLGVAALSGRVLNEEAVAYGSDAGEACGGRFGKMRDEYESRLQTLRRENQGLKALVASKERDISHLESIMRVMQRLKGLTE